MPDSRIRVYLDATQEPIIGDRPPTAVALDTKSLADDEHDLRIEAQDATGHIGIRYLRFLVRSGPRITVTGLDNGAVVHGTVVHGQRVRSGRAV